jgi:DNA-3-methyladenine glycosylase II
MTSVIAHQTVLAATQPYSFACSLRALAGFAPCAGDQLVAEGRVRKAFPRPRPPGEPETEAVVVEVGEDPAGVTLTVFAASPLNAAETAGVESAVRRWLSLDDDLTGFLAVAGADPAMAARLGLCSPPPNPGNEHSGSRSFALRPGTFAGCAQAPALGLARGLHQVCFAGLAEGAVYFTLTQRSTQWFAAARKRRIAAERGLRAVVDGVSYAAFPSLPAIGAISDEDLVAYTGNRQRADRVRSVVTGLAALDESWLRSGAYDEVRRALLAVPGIGTFTAHAILLRVLGRPEDVPLEMAQFTDLARALYGEPPPSPAEIRERYSPWVGWWAYLGRTTGGWIDRSAELMAA